MPDRPAGTVTFLFSDVEGSTEALQRLGDAYAAALGEHRRTTREAVEQAGGDVVDARGEEHFVVFGRAHDAVAAARGIQLAQRHHALKARIGVHTGEPSLDGEGYLGLDVHYAARICAAGHGGQVLLSASTRALLPDAEARDLGEHALKGIAVPARIFQLLAPDLPQRFPPLRTDRPTAERTRALAGVAARLRRTKRPSYDELSWSVRALMAVGTEVERTELARLRASLIDATRVAGDTDAYLATADRRALTRQLAEYREMSLVSCKASEHAQRLLHGIESLDELIEARTRLDDAVYAERRMPEDAATATLDIGRAATGLRATLDRTAGLIPALRGKLRRTRHRGVYRLGDRWVVPWFDTVGVEHRAAFGTRSEARAFARSQRLADQHEYDYADLTPSYKGVKVPTADGFDP